MTPIKVLIIDDEPEVRLTTLKRYISDLFSNDEIEFIHAFTVPDVIDFDVVSFDGDGGNYGDYLKQLKDCSSVKIKTLAIIHTMNPIKAKEFMFVLRNDLVVEGRVIILDFGRMNNIVNGHKGY